MRVEERAAVREWTGMWWIFLITGIAWLLISLIVLRFTTTSITTVGIMLGVVFLAFGFNELLIGSVREGGWRWVHVLLGILFVVGAFGAFFRPVNAFWALASILGFLLLFKGTLDIVASVMTKELNELWWLGLVVGILEILLAFWVSQQYFAPRAALILIWVGFAAVFRGVSEIVLAFQLRRVGKEVAAGAM